MRTIPTLAILSALAALVFEGRGAAGESAYGSELQQTIIPAASFRPASSADTFSWSNGTITPTSGGETVFLAPIDLPNGALLYSVTLLIVDTDPASDIKASVFRFGQAVAATQTCTQFFWVRVSNGILGRDVLVLGDQPLTIQSRGLCNSVDSETQFFVRVNLNSTNHSLSGAVLLWRRQVSPAPATATFDDVPTSDPFFRAIEALAASGITSGCGNNNFCPNQAVTRNQLAKFLANALGLHFPQ
jgi:S-layer homology domain